MGCDRQYHVQQSMPDLLLELFQFVFELKPLSQPPSDSWRVMQTVMHLCKAQIDRLGHAIPSRFVYDPFHLRDDSSSYSHRQLSADELEIE